MNKVRLFGSKFISIVVSLYLLSRNVWVNIKTYITIMGHSFSMSMKTSKLILGTPLFVITNIGSYAILSLYVYSLYTFSLYDFVLAVGVNIVYGLVYTYTVTSLYSDMNNETKTKCEEIQMTFVNQLSEII